MWDRRLQRATCRPALSWIDILFMLAIILLLVLILLPALRDAREQARVARCLFNLRVASWATNQYLLDFDNAFPLTYRPAGLPRRAFSYAYGGRTNDDFWRTVMDGAGYIPLDDRPLNAYLVSAQATLDRAGGTRESNTMDLQMLHCLSDRTSYARAAFDPRAVPLPQACFDDLGTSYHFNLHALTGTNVDPGEDDGENWTVLGRAMFRAVLTRHSHTFGLFLPDPMYYALPEHRNVVGNHGRRGMHEMGFLDGHAEYGDFDTSRWAGPDWTALVPDWIRPADDSSPPGIRYTAPDKAGPSPGDGAPPRPAGRGD